MLYVIFVFFRLSVDRLAVDVFAYVIFGADDVPDRAFEGVDHLACVALGEGFH